MNRFAVIPTRDRPLDLLNCLRAVGPQVDAAVVVDNSDAGLPDEWYVAARDLVGELHRVWLPEQPPNLSRLWNMGLDRAAELWRGGDRYGDPYEIAVLNDDAIVSDMWFTNLSRVMRSSGATAAGAGPAGPLVHRTPGRTALHERMPGWAFILAGEANLRADERLRWWCGDNDLDMQARKLAGTVIVPEWQVGGVEHLYPDQSTVGVLREQTAVDMAYFVEKWGFRPW